MYFLQTVEKKRRAATAEISEIKKAILGVRDDDKGLLRVQYYDEDISPHTIIKGSILYRDIDYR